MLLLQELDAAQNENSRLTKICKEQEQTLMDMGVRLSESTLKMEDLREASKGFVEAQWTDDKDVTHCGQCSKEFSLRRRKVSLSNVILICNLKVPRF